MNKKPKLLDHEKELLSAKLLKDITHTRSTSIWLHGESSTEEENCVNVYRVMGDKELLFLLQNKNLPNTQPYQAIVEGDEGRKYMEKFLSGQKYVATNPTTIVEFIIKKEIFNQLFAIQHKIEDGVLSIGLGNKAGNGLKLFNANIKSFRIVTVKRKIKN
jgi:hypothetical protein